MAPSVRSLLARYGVALLALAAALLARLAADPLVGNALPFLTFSLAVVTAAWYGGFGPSLLALVLGLLAATYFFIPPRYSRAASLAAGRVRVAGFLFLGVSIGLFSEGLRAARRRAEAHARELEHEVARRELLEEELQRRADALAEADRRKDEFLAVLAHELRNPLAPIRHAAQALHDPDLAASRLRWAREVIDRQSGQLARLVDDLLDVSRIARGKVALNK